MKPSLNHIAITTSDLVSAKAFWETVFQAEKLERPSSGISSEGVWYKLGDLELHILVREKPGNKTDQHFALEVDDLDELKRRARGMGAMVETRESLPEFTRRVYLYDPDDNRVELLQK
ncbi:MAG: VOC family protein [candidate division Zixibacteria bacterium]|nr:VOC family protein [candidate division Zixibacteria bacterium]